MAKKSGKKPEVEMFDIKTLLEQATEGAAYDPLRPVSSALRVALLSTGLDSAELARRSGVSQSSIYRFLTGQRGLSLDSMDRVFRNMIEVKLQIDPTKLNERFEDLLGMPLDELNERKKLKKS